MLTRCLLKKTSIDQLQANTFFWMRSVSLITDCPHSFDFANLLSCYRYVPAAIPLISDSFQLSN